MLELSRYRIPVFVVFLIGLSLPLSWANPTNDQPTYGITHGEIKKAIETLARVIKSLESKLFRHEAREKQVADYSTKTLNIINSALTNAHLDKNLETLTRQLSKMEERLIATESLIQMNDEKQTLLINQLNDGINRLLTRNPTNDFPPHPDFTLALPPPSSGTVDSEIKRAVSKIDRNLEKGMREMSNEIKIVGETMEMFTSIVTERHDRLEASVNTHNSDVISNINDVTDNLGTVISKFEKDVSSASARMNGGGGGCAQINNDVMKKLEDLDRLYRDQETDLKVLTVNSNKAFETQKSALSDLYKQSKMEGGVINGSVLEILADLKDVTVASEQRLQKLGDEVRKAIKESTKLLKGDVSNVAKNVEEGTGHIMDVLGDTGSQVESLQKTVDENHDNMQSEIKSIGKVEQVMINTADAVLETKRSIEFGIQQVILELSEIVKNSGSTINTTLSDQIRNISFDIIKNQTTALTNMTTKVEKEISQVWRQIGSMYQQMSQTVDLLDDLQNTTKTHMNASLSHVGNMDGTVGKINNKVAGVEDNLNYLLGSLSLVVSEFNNMKSGVGNELEKLRDLAQSANIDVTSDPNRQIPIRINSRRHAIYNPNPRQFTRPNQQSTRPRNYNNPYNDPYYGQVLPRHPQLPPTTPVNFKTPQN